MLSPTQKATDRNLAYLFFFAYAALLAFREHNLYSVDGVRTKPIA
jgi:hypothetical protein